VQPSDGLLVASDEFFFQVAFRDDERMQVYYDLQYADAIDIPMKSGRIRASTGLEGEAFVLLLDGQEIARAGKAEPGVFTTLAGPVSRNRRSAEGRAMVGGQPLPCGSSSTGRTSPRCTRRTARGPSADKARMKELLLAGRNEPWIGFKHGAFGAVHALVTASIRKRRGGALRSLVPGSLRQVVRTRQGRGSGVGPAAIRHHLRHRHGGRHDDGQAHPEADRQAAGRHAAHGAAGLPGQGGHP